VCFEQVSVGAGMIGHPVGHMELELGHLRDAIAHVIQQLVMGQKQTPTIRRALLQHIGSLCQFFGPCHSNDFLLPILPAFLNDHDEQLRATFFNRIVHVCLFVGQMSLEAYLLPCIEQALNDVEETVIVNAMQCLAALCTHQLLRKRVLLEAVERASPLLCHPSEWVRRAAIILVAATSANLEPADSYAFLMPILGPFLRREPASLCSEVALLACLKPPVSREVFNRVLGDVMLLQTERETAATAKHGGKKTKGRRVAPIQPSPELVGITSNRPAKERRKPDRDGGKSPAGSRDLSQSALKNGAKQAPVSVPPIPSFLKPVAGVSEGEDGEKMKAMEGYIRNLSSIMQSRMHNWEAVNTEKLQSSSIGFTAGVGAGFYSNYDGSSEGIPLYSVPLMERKSGEGMPAGQGSAPQGVDGNPSNNEDWSRVFGTHQVSAPSLMATIAGTPISGSIGPASSQWANIGVQSSLSSAEASMQRSHVAMAGSFTPRLLARSVYQGIGSASQGQFDSVKDVGRYDSGEGLLATGFGAGVHSISTSKASLASPSHMVSAGGKSGEAAPLSILNTDASIGVVGIPFLSSSGAPESPWRPRGVLIAHLQEHQRAVNDVTVSADNIFFASASDDGTVKIWDCRRLERDISFRSRMTYPLQAEGRALHVTMLGNGHHVGAASGNGTIHVFAVDYVARLGGNAEHYTGISNTCKLDTQEGNILSLQSFSNDGPPQLLYSTQCNGVHLWDLRTQTDVWTLRAKPAQGFISTTALDPACNWLVSGTSRGILTLWDLRVQVSDSV
jgi:phosphoinositide-3-kinase regulatory subunit 4